MSDETTTGFEMLKPLALCPNPGHATMRSADGLLSVPVGFSYGQGTTGLDTWVRRFGDADYLRQWSPEAWLIAGECATQLEHSARLCACAPVPAWFLAVAGDRLAVDPDTPAPTIGQFHGGRDHIDWLALRAAEPDRWRIEFPWPQTPTIDQVRTVQAYCTARGADNGLWITFDTPTNQSVFGAAYGLIIHWNDAATARDEEEMISPFLEGTSAYLNRTDPDGTQQWMWC